MFRDSLKFLPALNFGPVGQMLRGGISYVLDQKDNHEGLFLIEV